MGHRGGGKAKRAVTRTLTLTLTLPRAVINPRAHRGGDEAGEVLREAARVEEGLRVEVAVAVLT